MKHNKQAWTIAVLFLLVVSGLLLGGWQINNGGSGGGSSAFSSLTGGTNTSAAMVLGSGSSLATSGTGLITSATFFGGCAGTAISNGTTSVYGLGPLNSSAGTCATTFAPASSINGAPAPFSCSIKYLSARSSAVGVNASDGVVTVWVAQSSTALTCTIGTGTTCTDQTHAVAVTAGQQLNVAIVTQTSSTLGNMAVSFVCQ